jgi:hypothetical protein
LFDPTTEYEYFQRVHLREKKDALSENTTIGRKLDRIAQNLTGIPTNVNHSRSQEPDDAEKRHINFKKNKKVKITTKDREEVPEIAELYEAIQYLNTKKDQIDDEITKNQLKKWISDLKDNQKLIKQMVLKPIDFKKLPHEDHYVDKYHENSEEFWQDFYPHPPESPYDLDLFETNSWEGILRLLPFTEVDGALIKKYLRIFNTITHLCVFTDEESKLLRSMINPKKDHYKKLDRDDYKFYKNCFLTNADMAERLKIDQRRVCDRVNSIATKLRNQYEKYFIQEWYYCFYIKGKYKTCTQCGQPKLLTDFAKNASHADGLQNVCKECFNSNFKICSKCGQRRNKNMFGLDSRNSDGLKSICKICNKNY